jgi:hypothetical protein
MNIDEIDAATEKALAWADRIRAEKMSAPQHYEAADLHIQYRVDTREFSATLGGVSAYSTVSVESAIEGLAQELERIARSRGIR